LNLGLKILDRRKDGFHNIHSLFQTIDLFDEIAFEWMDRAGFEVVCDSLPADDRNLVYRAADAISRFGNAARGIRITLCKGIPVGAGLGGGSSDAANVLLVLNTLWKLDLGDCRIHEIAASLGSDVPFFLNRGTAVVSGRGDEIRFINARPDFTYVLVYPEFEVSSGWAYQNLRIGLTETSIYSRFLNSVEESGKCCPDSLLACLENDFLPLLDDRFPLIGSVLSALHQSGAAVSSVSGSGSTVYGIFRDPSQAGQAASNLVDLGHPVYLCRPCQE
jgi:4-diphosphocytidyl-2-C-methyl-D-erythritol kinase